MAKIADVPLTLLSPANDGVVAPRPDGIQLTSDPQQWAYSAVAWFDVPGMRDAPRAIRIRLEVQVGELGAGWVTRAGDEWVSRTSAAAARGVAQELLMELPAGTDGGFLVFDNWTRGDRAARALIYRIEIVEVERRTRRTPAAETVTVA